jgi:hypothetical protein
MLCNTIAVALVTVALNAHAQRWHAVALPLYRGLPEVSIDLGYPGSYVPAANSPIELHARATEPFDGAIGFRFAVDRAFTKESAVIARAKIARGGTWTFGTTAQLAFPGTASDREVVIEWRDRTNRVMARRHVGAPKWSRSTRPLRIGGTAPQIYLDDEAVVIQPADLASDAQWYAGFSAVVTPVDVWLDLRLAVREAIFHSGAPLDFFGVPRDGQHFATIDDALIPVRFTPGAGDVDVPLLLRKSGVASLTAPMSWRAVDGAEIIGASERPYIVTTAAASFAASEDAFREPLPAASPVIRLPGARMFLPDSATELAGVYLSHTPVLPPLLAALVIAPFLWLRLKKSADLRLAAIALITAAALLGSRSAFHAAHEVVVTERWRVVQPNIALHTLSELEYGDTPLRASLVETTDVRTLIGRRIHNDTEDTEVRTSNTLAGHGSLEIERPWHSSDRLRVRREIGTPADVHVRSMSNRQLVFDYRVSIRPQRVFAIWTFGGSRYGGEVAVDRASGRATIAAGTLHSDSFESIEDGAQTILLHRDAESVRVVFREVDGSDRRFVEWEGAAGRRSSFIPYSLTAVRKPHNDRTSIMTYRLPSDPWPAKGRITAWPSFGSMIDGNVEVIGEHGTLVLKTSNVHFDGGRALSEAPLQELMRVARPGELVQLRFKAQDDAQRDEPIEMKLRIERKSS